jgi:hypothetical protein
MGNFKPPFAMAVQQRRSGCSDTGWEPSRVGTLPVSTEDSAVSGVNGYDDVPGVPPFVKIDPHYFAGLQPRVLFVYCGFTGSDELGPDRVRDIH